MPKITGYYRPGQARGEASGYSGVKYDKARGGGGGGFLDKLKNMKLKLAKEQLLQMQIQRNAQRQAYDRGPLPQGGGPTRNTAQEAADARRMAQSLLAGQGPSLVGPDAVGTMIESIGRPAAHEGLMQSGRILGGLSQGMAGAPRGGQGQAAEQGQEDVSAAIRTYPPPVDPQMFLGQLGAQAGGSKFMGPVQSRPPVPTYETHGGMGSVVGPMGPQLPPGRGVRLRPMEEGTLPGTVPKTGKTTVHRGEVVLPKEQVTPGLLAMLIGDAEQKGTLPKSYKCGSLKKGYQEGSLEEELKRRAWWENLQPMGREEPEPEPIRTIGEEPEEAPGGLKGFARSLGYGAGQITDLLATALGGVRGAGAEITSGFTGQPVEPGGRKLYDVASPGKIEEMQAGGEPALAEEGGIEPQAEPIPPQPTTGGSSRDDLYKQLRGMPEQIRAQHKAKMSEIEAERLLDILRFNRSIDPDVAKSILDKAAFNMKLSDKYSGMARGREKAVEEEFKASAGLDRQIEYWREKEKATGERQMDVKTLEALLGREAKTSEARTKLIMDLHLSHAKEVRGSIRGQLLEKLGNVLRQEYPELGQDEAMMIASQITFLEAEEAKAEVAAIMGGRE